MYCSLKIEIGHINESIAKEMVRAITDVKDNNQHRIDGNCYINIERYTKETL